MHSRPAPRRVASPHPDSRFALVVRPSLPRFASSAVCLIALGGRGFFAYADAEDRRAANVRSAHWLTCAFVFEERAASGKEH
jgi:hypothetical protein